MYIIRTVAGVGLAVALLPSDPQGQEALLRNAQDKMTWVMTYCARQPEQCQQARDTWDATLIKAQFGMQLASELVQQYGREQQQEVALPMPDTSETTTIVPKPVRTRRVAGPETDEQAWQRLQPISAGDAEPQLDPASAQDSP
jgi:hypothetical protein